MRDFMDSVYLLLQKIRKRPTMYLGEKSITRLHFLIFGFIIKELEINSKHMDCLNEFTKFVQKKVNDELLTIDWRTMILNDSKNEEEAFDKFYLWLDECFDSKS